MTTGSHRLAELDGVRGIAILLVLLWHVGDRLPPEIRTFTAYLARANGLSWSGVDLFFVLSGFLIGGGLLDSREADGYFTGFYLRRACRILPLYLVMLFIVIGFDHFGIEETGSRLIPFGYYLTFTQNFWMLKNGWSLALGQTWSLAVEEQFYLTLPLLIWLTPRRHLVPLLIALAIAAPLFRTAIVLTSTDPLTAIHVMLPCRMDALLFGVLAAIVLRSPAARRWLDQNPRALYAAFAVLTASAAFMLAKQWVLGSPAMMTAGYSILAALYTTFLLLALREGPVQKLCRLSWLRQAGIWAYGLYLIHGIMLDFLIRAAGAHPHARDSYDWTVLALSIGIVFGIAALSWRYFEKPLIDWGHRLTLRRTDIPIAQTSVAASSR